MSTPLVLPMSAEYVEAFHAALDVVARERSFLTLLEAPPLEATRAFVLAGMAANNPAFLAVSEGAVVGWCDIRRDSFPAHAHRGSVGMGILPKFRGQGLGKRLIKATLEAAWDCGLTRVELSVHSDNKVAMALYEKVGFVREGVCRNAFLADGIYRDSVLMAILRR